ncbi:pyridoxine/pyridoxamine 5'-phosphate oxidase [Agromyces salentinus]|uniref:Pyridoxal 5'-phosphate synthase n=1 Tax=Agromyces salentinus TaxID=269421 RepID=A0ABN2MFY6_9MICO|nr:pyridoxal 5'-phosphate synthase [Agromyces salentinus]
MTTLRDRLRSTPSIVGRPPHFDPSNAPDEPRALFVDWLEVALAAEVAEPHALTLSNVDPDGRPDARILVLKDVTADGSFEIATGDESAKGRQLGADPHVALTFYWTPLARSVRVRGLAERATPAESASDFRARNAAAKAIALAGRQSAPLLDLEERDRIVAERLARLESEPDLVSPEWTVWRVRPASIEFWQGDPGRNHLRLRYERTEHGWDRLQLWA